MNPSVKLIIQSANIPPVPEVLRQIMALADNPRTTSAQLEKLVSREPALSAQILKWVNSALYALPRKISSIGHAMILLGFSTVKSVASGMVMMDLFNNLEGLRKDYVIAIWQKGIIASHFMRILAGRENTENRDDLFLTAMIHHVGHLVLSQHFQKEYDVLLQNTLFPDPETEQQALAVDHAETGAALLQVWNFPDRVVNMVTHHHKPAEYQGLRQNMPYLWICNFLSHLPDLGEFLSPERTEDQIDKNFLSHLQSVMWNWPKLLAQRRELMQALEVLQQIK